MISQPLNYEEVLGYNTEVRQYLDDIIFKGLIEYHNELKAKNYTLLFDKYDVRKSVATHPNDELHFFDWVTNNRRLIYKPFPIRVSEEGSLVAINNDFVDQLRTISKQQNEKDDYLLNTPVFGEFDSRGLNMRLFIFPKTVRPKFFEIGIKYEYRKKSESDYNCIGLISSVTNCIANQKYNIWSSSNYTTESTSSCERGKLIYLVEDVNETRTSNTEEKLLKTINLLINEATLCDSIHNNKIEITDVIISQLSSLKIKRKIDVFSNKDFLFDIFISFSLTNSDTALLIKKYLEQNGLSCAISLDIGLGEDFYEKIGHNLRSSREMILLYSDIYHESNWRKAEEAVFWAFKRVITPVLFNDMKFEKLDKFIDRNNAVKLLDLSDPNFIPDLEDKIERLVRDIKDRKAIDMLDMFERVYDK